MSRDEPWRRVLVLGGARSGKSAFAEQLASECDGPVVYVAAATVEDPEMAERVRHHRERRPTEWRTLEVRRDVAKAVAALPDVGTVLVEDLTLLLADRFRELDDEGGGTCGNSAAADGAERAVADEVAELLRLRAHVILVSNEVGMGIVPASPMGRLFRDALGRVNQGAARDAHEVYVLVAGLPLRLKPGDAGGLARSTFP